VVQPRADSEHKVVSAASICAKVTRDKILSEWKFRENLSINDFI
jgi:ribonuclease HII